VTECRNATRGDASYVPKPEDRARWRAEDEADERDWRYENDGSPAYVHRTGGIRIVLTQGPDGPAWRCIWGGSFTPGVFRYLPDAKRSAMSEALAAAAIKAKAMSQERPRHGTLKAQMLAALSAGPRTSNELAAELGLSLSTASAIVHKLLKDGTVRHNGYALSGKHRTIRARLFERT
jgi:hypothetical protein